MASSAIFLTIVIFVVIACTNGFRIENAQEVRNVKLSRLSSTPSPVSKFGSQPPPTFPSRPIITYPKVPPPNARESGGHEDDLLPPFESTTSGFDDPKNPSFRRSIDDVKKDPKTGYPLVAQPSWKDAGGNERTLELPLEDSENVAEQEGEVDPKTGYPLVAQPGWKHAGGDGEIIELPLEETSFGQKSDAVDPKTGYPLVAQPSWQDAGGNELILELPLEDLEVRSGDEGDEALDPKTGYPLVAQPSWKDAGGDGEILELPLEETADEVAVDPKTGYPLAANPSWKYAGGDEHILELPLEETPEKPTLEGVDPKTGYPLLAQASWKHAGGDGEILEPPLEESEKKTNREANPQEAVDPKTGYPLAADPTWKHAGGDGDILEPPFETPPGKTSGEAVDPKTGYPLVAQASWKNAGGDGDILELPLEDSHPESAQEAVDPKTGYPLKAQPGWKDAGGNEDILELPLLEPTGNSVIQSQGRSGEVFNIAQLRELLPPSEEKYYPLVFRYALSNASPTQKKPLQQTNVIQRSSQNQKRNLFETPKTRSFAVEPNRPVESSYTYTGPENVVVTVTRYLNTDLLQKKSETNSFQTTTQSSLIGRQNFQSNNSQTNGVRGQFQFKQPTRSHPATFSNLNRNPS